MSPFIIDYGIVVMPCSRYRLFLCLWSIILSSAITWGADIDPPASASSQLVFDSRNLQFHPAVTDSELITSFPFTNRGTGAITITDVATSCGCTATHLDKRTYGPGERGAIGVTFSAGDRTGKQVKTIKVVTDEQGHAPVTLTMDIDLPIGPEITPRFLDWDVGPDLAEKIVSITVPDKSEYVIQGVESKDPRIHAILSQQVDGHHYAVAISLTDSLSPYASAINVITNFRKFRIYIRVSDSDSGRR